MKKNYLLYILIISILSRVITSLERSNLTKLASSLEIVCEKFDNQAYENSFNTNLGPFPAEERPNSVVENILILVDK